QPLSARTLNADTFLECRYVVFDTARLLTAVTALGFRVLSRSGRSEPGRKCLRQLRVREVSCPGDMPVGSDQHGRGSIDLAKDRELPHAIVPGVDQPDSIRPRRNVGTAGLTEVEEHGPGVVQQGEYARGTVRGMQVEVGHAP